MPSLHLYQRPTEGTGFREDLTRYWPTWRRTTRALGGFWTGEFAIPNGTMSRYEMWNFYLSNIGRLLKEKSYGLVTWEGEIYEMTITIDGVSERITLDPDRWHNKVKVQYTYPRIEDTEQGVLSYNPPATSNEFKDTGQDFSDWETNPAAAPPATYMIEITNDDDTTVTAYIGNVSGVSGNAGFVAYKDVELDNLGFNGVIAAKTPLTYIISNVELAGVSQSTAWSETTDSSDRYGEAQFIDVRGEMAQAVAEGIRAQRLTEHAYPKSIPVDSLSSDETQEERSATLDIMVAGYAFSMTRRFMETDVDPANASAQIAVLVDGSADAAEFVTAGTIDTNVGGSPSIMCSEMNMRLWDLCEELTAAGDGAGARWIAGVYAGRVMNYQAAETTSYYYWSNGRLLNHGRIPVYPTLIRPNIIVQPARTAGSTTGSASTRQFYVEEVEFIAPRSYRLIPYEGEALFGTY